MEEVMRTLGRLEGKMDSLLGNRKHDTARIDTVEGRVDAVEKKVWYASGFAAAIAFAASKLGLFH